MCGLVPTNEGDEDILPWALLKLEPKKPTKNNMKDFIRHVNELLELRQKINVPIDFIAPARLEQLRDEAMIADMDDMKDMRPIKRYGLAVILISIMAGSALDDLVQIFITWIRHIETNAKYKLEAYRIEKASQTDQ